MRPRELRWRRLLTILIGFGLVAICLVPWWIGDTSQFGLRVTDRLQRWTGGSVQITGPMRIRYFPDISIRSGIKLSDTRLFPAATSLSCPHAKISLNLAALLIGRVRIAALKLVEPQIIISDLSGHGSQGLIKTETALLRLVRNRPLDRLDIKDGQLTIASPMRAETIRHLTAHIDAAHAKTASGNGSFEWRGVPVHFALQANFRAANDSQTPGGGDLPLSFSIDSAPITAHFKGQVSFRPKAALNGTMDAKVADVRRLLDWTGVAKVKGPGLKQASADGTFQMQGGSLTFDQGQFSIDGNEATGLVSVSLSGTRPQVEATLAFGSLNLDPYLVPPEGKAPGKAAPAKEAPTKTAPTKAMATPPASSLATSLPSGAKPSAPGSPVTEGSATMTALRPIPVAVRTFKPPLDWPLVRAIDADLRLSADSVVIDNQALGSGALTLTANNGVLTGDIGELQLCGGEASGRFTLDVAKPVRRIKINGSLQGIDLQSCLQMFHSTLPFRGLNTVQASLSTTGSDWKALLGNVTGDVQVKSSNGTLPLPIADVAEAKTPQSGAGWSSDSGTPFTSLSTDCHAAGGYLRCQHFVMQTANGTVSGNGTVNLLDTSLDWRLRLNKTASKTLSPTTPGATSGTPPAKAPGKAASSPAVKPAGAPPKAAAADYSQPLQIAISGPLARPLISRVMPQKLDGARPPEPNTVSKTAPKTKAAPGTSN